MRIAESFCLDSLEHFHYFSRDTLLMTQLFFAKGARTQLFEKIFFIKMANLFMV